jgi:hypothetical protein
VFARDRYIVPAGDPGVEVGVAVGVAVLVGVGVLVGVEVLVGVGVGDGGAPPLWTDTNVIIPPG